MNYLKKVLLSLIFMTFTVMSDGFIIFPVPYPIPLSVKYHKVTCIIDNGVAQTTIDQVFVNNTEDELIDGKYVFPVPDGATIGEFNIEVDGVTKSAELMDTQEANEFFQNAVMNSSQAALLSYMDNETYSLDLANIPPASQRKIKISYIEVLEKIDNITRYIYPLNTEKFSLELIDTVTIDVAISNSNSITSVFSPSHDINIERIDKHTVKASYAEYYSRPNRDFELFYKLSDIEISFHLFTYKEPGEDGYFLMLITPQHIEDNEQTVTIAKDMVFTIDRSGSMSGTKIEQARDALSFCINRLKPEDYFNIVTFDDEIISNAEEMLIANSENVISALNFVETITDGGMTDIAQALVTSLNRINSSSAPHYVIFLTDGLPTAGITDQPGIVSAVNDANANDARIFSVGFGYDVNSALLDQISDENGGFSLYCDPEDNIEAVISQLYRMIESPVLTSPQISIDGIEIYDTYPIQILDIFEGSEIAFYGRYVNQGSATVTLTGNAGSEQKTFTYSADFPSENTDYDFVPRLWATQKIAQLMADIKNGTLSQAEEETLVDSIKALSLTYGIITPYTAMFFTAPDGNGDQYVYDGLVESVGMDANDASNYQNEMQQSTNSGQTVMQDESDISWYLAPKANQVQNIGDKIFVYSEENIWVDATLDSTAEFDTVYYATEEYFELASENPELLNYMTVGNQAAINYLGKSYIIIDKNAPSPIITQSDITLSMRGRFDILQQGSGVRFSLPETDTRATVSIYSTNGMLICKITAGKSKRHVVWDGRTNAGGSVSNGIYTAVFRNRRSMDTRRFVYFR